MLRFLILIVCLIWWKVLQLLLVLNKIRKDKRFKLISKILILFLRKRTIQLLFKKNMRLFKLKETVLHSNSPILNLFCIKKIMSILSVTFINQAFTQKIKLWNLEKIFIRIYFLINRKNIFLIFQTKIPNLNLK